MAQLLDSATVWKLQTGQYVPCSAVHEGSCEVHALKRILLILPKALKVYGPVHLVPLIVFRLKQLKNSPKETTIKFLVGLCRSMAFISTYMSLEKFAECYCNYLLHGYRSISPVLVSLVATHAIYLESPHRRNELSLYLLPRSMETLWNIAKTANYVKPLPYGEVGLFMLGLGLMLSFYQTEQEYLPYSYTSYMVKLLGDN
mmetsp:Transcript_6825/g.12347  ORF Transcript_6825/g.12347 Transcript_6825/m.12347 type:complete len:201 (+) Transcript_6825:2964-3566(+)